MVVLRSPDMGERSFRPPERGGDAPAREPCPEGSKKASRRAPSVLFPGDRHRALPLSAVGNGIRQVETGIASGGRVAGYRDGHGIA